MFDFMFWARINTLFENEQNVSLKFFTPKITTHSLVESNLYATSFWCYAMFCWSCCNLAVVGTRKLRRWESNATVHFISAAVVLTRVCVSRALLHLYSSYCSHRKSTRTTRRTCSESTKFWLTVLMLTSSVKEAKSAAAQKRLKR